MKIHSVNLNPLEIHVQTNGTGVRFDGVYGQTDADMVWDLGDLLAAPPSAAGVIIGLALGRVTEDLFEAKAAFRRWAGEQTLVLREPVPGPDPKKPKRPTADEVKSMIETADTYLVLKAKIGVASGKSNTLAAVGSAIAGHPVERVEVVR